MDRKWYIIDAKGVVLGRLATFVATLLQGKHLPDYQPHADTGTGVIVTNMNQVRITGRKMQQKLYFSHSGYPGGDRYITMEKLFQKSPELVLKHAVKGMLPKNKLRAQRLKRLKVYNDEKHNHPAQKPEEIKVGLWKQFKQ